LIPLAKDAKLPQKIFAVCTLEHVLKSNRNCTPESQ